MKNIVSHAAATFAGLLLGVAGMLFVEPEPARNLLTQPVQFACQALDDDETLVCRSYKGGTKPVLYMVEQRDYIRELKKRNIEEPSASIDCRFYYGGYLRDCSFAVG